MREARHKTPHIVWLHLCEVSKIGKSIETESRLVVARGWRGEENGEWLLMGTDFLFWGDENVLKLTAMMVAHSECTKSCCTVHFKRVNVGFPGGTVVKNLPMQGTRVRALVRENHTCCRATKPVCHNYWACTLEPVSHNYWARVPQLLKPTCLEPVLCNKRSHRNEKPVHCNKE